MEHRAVVELAEEFLGNGRKHDVEAAFAVVEAGDRGEQLCGAALRDGVRDLPQLRLVAAGGCDLGHVGGGDVASLLAEVRAHLGELRDYAARVCSDLGDEGCVCAWIEFEALRFGKVWKAHERGFHLVPALAAGRELSELRAAFHERLCEYAGLEKLWRRDHQSLVWRKGICGEIFGEAREGAFHLLRYALALAAPSARQKGDASPPCELHGVEKGGRLDRGDALLDRRKLRLGVVCCAVYRLHGRRAKGRLNGGLYDLCSGRIGEVVVLAHEQVDVWSF